MRPAPVLVGIDELGLEPIDPAHEPRQQRVGTAAEVVVPKRELVDPFDEHRESVTRAERGRERVDPGAGASQHERRELGRGQHVELLIAERERGLETFERRGGARRAGHDEAQPLGRGALLDQPPKARLDHSRLAGSGGARYDQPARLALGDGGTLRGAAPVEQPLLHGAGRKQTKLPGLLAACVVRAHRLTA